MRAVVVTRFGAAPEVIELPVPEPGPGELLIKIRAAGLNPFDWKVADGALASSTQHLFPLVLGSDGAGEVTSVGPDVRGFSKGDRVFGRFMDVRQGRGSFAEFVLVSSAGQVAHLPDAIHFDLAAALPTASLTAQQVVQQADPGPGQVVLIVGATGGVGQSAVQFVAGRGAQVIATAHTDQADRMRRLGAAATVDHTVGPVQEQVRVDFPGGLDVVIDLVTSAGSRNPYVSLLRPGGMLVSTNGAANPSWLAELGVRGVNLSNHATATDLLALVKMVVDSDLQVHISRKLELADAPSALLDSRAGTASGKTVILP